jgi:hypothetical protein
MKFPMDEKRLADGASFDQSARFLAKRVIPKVMRDATDHACFFFHGFEHGRFPRIHCERFFAKDVLAGAHERACLFEVNVVRRTDVNARDFFIRGKFCEGGVGSIETEGFCGGVSPFSSAEHAAAYVNAKAAERLQVCAAYES